MAKRQKVLELKGKGVEHKSIPEVLVAGEAYERARDARMKKSKGEKDAKNALIDVMIKHGETVYKDDEAAPPILITVSTTHNVKVQRVTEDEDEGDEEKKGGEDLN